MPPALSVMGPKASRATMIPVMDNMEVAAMAMPYNSASWYAPQMLAHTASTGRAVAFMETPMPAMMLVA